MKHPHLSYSFGSFEHYTPENDLKPWDAEQAYSANLEHINSLADGEWTNLILRRPDDETMNTTINGVLIGENRVMINKLYSATEAQLDSSTSKSVNHDNGSGEESVEVPLANGSSFTESTFYTPDGSAYSLVTFRTI